MSCGRSRARFAAAASRCRRSRFSCFFAASPAGGRRPRRRRRPAARARRRRRRPTRRRPRRPRGPASARRRSVRRCEPRRGFSSNLTISPALRSPRARTRAVGQRLARARLLARARVGRDRARARGGRDDAAVRGAEHREEARRATAAAVSTRVSACSAPAATTSAAQRCASAHSALVKRTVSSRKPICLGVETAQRWRRASASGARCDARKARGARSRAAANSSGSRVSTW